MVERATEAAREGVGRGAGVPLTIFARSPTMRGLLSCSPMHELHTHISITPSDHTIGIEQSYL